MRGSDPISVQFHTLVVRGVKTPLRTAAVTHTGRGQGTQKATRIGGAA